MKDDNLPPDNETVEDGGGCYVAGSREQDAAHSFDGLDDEQLKIEINHILESGPNDIRLIELFERYYNRGAYWFDKFTRLRSELQQAKQEIANHTWTKIDGKNYPINTLLIVWNGTYNFAHFNTAYNKWVGQGHETTDTRNLMQFPPTHFMNIPEQPKQS